jgi:uncharacterized protein (DUF2249 family)
MEISKIEKGVPLPESKKRVVYSFFDEMELGDSIVIKGTKKETDRFRSAIRTRNQRYAAGPLEDMRAFDWFYVHNGIRVWRIM